MKGRIKTQRFYELNCVDCGDQIFYRHNWPFPLCTSCKTKRAEKVRDTPT